MRTPIKLLLVSFGLWALISCEKDDSLVEANLKMSLNAAKTGGTTIVAPSGLYSVPLTATAIWLSWKDNSSNESGFTVERKTSKGNYTRIATVAANSSSYQDNSPSNGVSYTYRIKAFSGTTTAYSNTITTSTSINLTTNLSAFYPFNGNANDESGNGNNGSVSGAILSTDRLGSANSSYSFNGSSNYIRIPGIDCSGSDKFTIALWVKPSTFSNALNSNILRQEIWGGPNTYDNLDWLVSFQNNGSNLSFGLSTGLQNTTQNPSAYTELDVTIDKNTLLNSWHLITCVYDGAKKYLYLDNTLIGTENRTGNVVYSSNIAAIGSASATIVEFFAGNIDDIRIYKRVLTSSEISYLATH